MEERFDEGADTVALVRDALAGHARVVLAVSGGLDSMVLLHAAALAVGPGRLRVATYDHATGPHASKAALLVGRQCGRLSVECIVGRADKPARRESEWRDERWRFLRAAAASFAGPIVTAHTLDDQIETVFIRILRDAGPRGLAGLFAESDIIRPLLMLRRRKIAQYAANNAVAFVEDPSNQSRLHLRNRIRHEILPAIVRVRPSFPADLIGISREAARWRDSMAALADDSGAETKSDGSLRIARAAIAGYDAEGLRALWPALAAKANVVMDRRGTHRLAEFTMKGHTGGSIQLSGGIEVRMFRDHLLLRRWDARRVEAVRSARARRGGLQPIAPSGRH